MIQNPARETKTIGSAKNRNRGHCETYMIRLFLRDERNFEFGSFTLVIEVNGNSRMSGQFILQTEERTIHRCVRAGDANVRCFR
jgi:hypothetical protein